MTVKSNNSPPIDPKNPLLPFYGHGFSWTTFEAFFCDFFSAGVHLKSPDGTNIEILEAHPYDVPGGSQKGIDIECRMENGETWAVQCKHRKKWGPTDTKNAVKAFTHKASRVILAITKEGLTTNARKPLPQNWELWDGRKISSEFFHRMHRQRAKAADILYRHFGRGWPEQFFDIRSRNPFLPGEAFYAELLKEGRVFDLRCPLAGRKTELKKLQDFTCSKSKQVFCLVAPAGQGKSRLLLEFQRELPRGEQTVLFLDRDHNDVECIREYLDMLKGPLCLVLDNADRRESELKALLSAAYGRPETKILLAHRPTPNGRIRRTLLEHHKDTSEIEKIELKLLPKNDCRKLAEELLEYEPSHTAFVAKLARQSPLLATITGRMIVRGQINQPIQNTDEFRDHIFTKAFAPQLESMKEGRPDEPFDMLLKTIALVSPLDRTSDNIMDTLAAFLQRERHQVSEYLDLLVKVGLLQQNRKQHFSGKETVTVQITPEMLASHFSQTACYSGSGQSTGFAEAVIQDFIDFAKPEILQNIAKAAWLNGNKTDDAPLAALWSIIRADIEDCPAREIFIEINKLRPVAAYLPRKLIELVEKVQQSEQYNEALLPEKCWQILKDIAVANPIHVSRCMDVLVRDTELDNPGPQNALLTMSDIATMEVWKSTHVIFAVTDWLEGACNSPQCLKEINLSIFLPALLRPYFKVRIPESWRVGSKLAGRDWHIQRNTSKKMRQAVLDFCEQRLEWDTRWQLGVLSILDVAIRPPCCDSKSPLPKKHAADFLEDRFRALRMIGRLMLNPAAPVVACVARRNLTSFFGYLDESPLKREAEILVANIQESVELEIVRVLTGNDSMDFGPIQEFEDWDLEYEERQKRWSALVDRSVKNFLDSSSQEQVFIQLEKIATRLCANGFNAQVSDVFRSVSKQNRKTAEHLATEMLARKDAEINSGYGSLVTSFPSCLEQQSAWIAKGIESECTRIQHSCIGSLGGLVRHPDNKTQREKLHALMHEVLNNRRLAQHHCRHIMLAWLGPWEYSKSTKLKLLPRLPDLRTNEDGAIFSSILQQMDSEDLSGSTMNSLILKLEHVPDLEKSSRSLIRLSSTFPASVYHLLRKRLDRSIERPEHFKPVPSRAWDMRFAGIFENPNILADFKRAIKPFLSPPWDYISHEFDFYRTVLFSSGNVELWGFWLQEMSSEQLENFTMLILFGIRFELSLQNPQIVKGILQRATELDQGLFQMLQEELAQNGVRSWTNGEPDKRWQSAIDAKRSLAVRFASDSILGPFYIKSVENEQRDIDRIHKDHVDEVKRITAEFEGS